MTSIIISTIALTVSFFSLLVSVYKIIRDKGKIKAIAKIIYIKPAFSMTPEFTEVPTIEIYITNTGIRPISIVSLKTTYNDNSTKYVSIPNRNTEEKIVNLNELSFDEIKKEFSRDSFLIHKYAIRLQENEVFEVNIDEHALFLICHPNNGSIAKKIYIEDSLGESHYVKNSDKCLIEFVNAIHNRY